MLSFLLLSSVLIGAIQCGPFQATISISPQHQLGEEVMCEVTISNTLETDLYLYTRHTPLRPSKADIFAVTVNGKRVPYDGLLFKMAPLRKDSDAILIPAKESLSKMLDLSQAYPMKEPGSYEVKLNSDVFYRTEKGDILHQSLASQSISFNVVPVSGILPRQTIGEKLRLVQNNSKPSNSNGTVKDPQYDGDGDDVDKKDAKSAWEGAYGILSTTSAVIDKADGSYVTWFGARDEGSIDSVKGVMESIQKSMEDDTYVLYFKGQECARDDYSYQNFKSMYIYLCPAYFRAEEKFDYNSKLGTFIHALTIAVANREDFPRIYSPEECQALAKDMPLRAVGSAYNYEYFCESLVK